jgi:simple sugar transport system ATP-binding protein
MEGAPPPAIALRGIDKRFGPVHANREVSLAVRRGTIHGIVGENGAGKSTLMNILYGFYQADAGEILIGGRPVRIGRPEDAIAAGVGMVHQHFMLVEAFSVLENIVLGAEDDLWIERSFTHARGALEALERDYGLQVDLAARVADLAVGDQQKVEILKVLYRGAEILILDEPTAVLTPQETEHLFRILGRLREEGKTVVLITHKLQEIMAVTDWVTVMRDGAVVATLETAETSREALAERMVGREVLLRVEKTPAAPGAAVLRVENLSVVDEAGVERVKDVSFELRAGEILGVAGVSGNGQSELLEALAGIAPPAAGRILLEGRDLARFKGPDRPRALRRLGLAHVPEDRLRMGMVGAFETSETAVLGYHDDPAFNGAILSDRGRIVDHCRDLMRSFDVRPVDPLLRSSALSGGNQQKLVLARELERDPTLLLVGQPTRGVDIGAIEFIHRRLVELRDAGKAVLLVSAELEEVLSLADRVLVMCDGRIVGALPTAGADVKRIGLMMAGIAEAPA